MTKRTPSASQKVPPVEAIGAAGVEDGTQAETAGENGKAASGKKPFPDQMLRAAFARASQVFGQAVSTMMQSPAHRHLLLSDLEWRVIPPIALQQYRLVQHKGAPAGFISWALVDEETEQRPQQPDFRLRPQDWTRGDRVWIIDVVTSAAQALVDKLTAELFKDREVQVRKGAMAGRDRGTGAAF